MILFSVDVTAGRIPASNLYALLRYRNAIAEQHDIGFLVGTQNAQGLTVRGEFKTCNVVGREICNLLAGSAVQWLPPKIIRAVISDRVDHRFSIAAKLCQTDGLRVWLERSRLRLERSIQRNNRQFLALQRSIGYLSRKKSQQLAVSR